MTQLFKKNFSIRWTTVQRDHRGGGVRKNMGRVEWESDMMTRVGGNKAWLRREKKGGSPGLVVMGVDSRSKRSWVRIPAPDTGWT